MAVQYKYIFGPVLSRRLGISLGIDLVPHKTCSMDCVYCECGKTTDLTMKLKQFVGFEAVQEELDYFWAHNDDPDYITFSGSGEPTLNSDLGRVIQYIKEKKPNIKVAVLTNSTLLNSSTVRKALFKADLVIPSLDAVEQKEFTAINRPFKGLNARDIAGWIKSFTREFTGKVWLEILILPGFNDSDAGLLELKEAVKEIRPDHVQLNTLDRPGTLHGLKAASAEELERVKTILDFPGTSIITKVSSSKKSTAAASENDLRQAILNTINRRPCTVQDLSGLLGAEEKQIISHLTVLEQKALLKSMTKDNTIFYTTLKKPN